MAELTERQKQILKAIIEEYMETAEPVGSESLEKKYELGISPATIRNEMVKLTKAGYLQKPHASAGRAPTPTAFKFYVAHLMEEEKLSVAEEVAAKEKIWDSRFDFDKLMKEVTKALAEQTRALAVATTKSGDIYHAGYANILDLPEFYDIDVTKAVLQMLDEAQTLFDLFTKDFDEGPVHLLLADELGYELLEPCGMAFTHFKAGPKRSGSLGVIGSSRFYYPRIIPVLKYFNNLIEELAQGF
jgi:heat-inducible transcriptional repressor